MLILKKFPRASFLLKPFYFNFQSVEKQTLTHRFAAELPFKFTITHYVSISPSDRKEKKNQMTMIEFLKSHHKNDPYFVKGT